MNFFKNFNFGGELWHDVTLEFTKADLVIDCQFGEICRINLADIDYYYIPDSTFNLADIDYYYNPDSTYRLEVLMKEKRNGKIELEFNDKKERFDFMELLGKHVPNGRNAKTIRMQRDEGNP